MQLSFGQFIGDVQGGCRSPGFACADLRHTSTGRLPLHSHADPHFVLILRGEYHTEAERVGHPRSTAPFVIYNPPGVTHRDQFCSPNGAFFTVSVEAQHTALLADCGLLHADARAFGENELSHIMLRMRQEVARPDALSGVVLEGLGLELVGGAARQLRRARECSGAPPWLDRAIELMREHCCHSLSVHGVALTVGVHPFHLARVVRAHLGASPGELMRRFRVERAVELLCRTDRTLSDIALTCGYADQSQFTRSFRRTLGTTPGAYRIKARGT